MKITINNEKNLILKIPYRDYEMSVDDKFIKINTPQPERVFLASAEGIRSAMAYIDKLCGPTRICVKCRKPILIDHKFRKSTNIIIGNNTISVEHRCCEYPESYDAVMGKKLHKKRFKGFGG